MLRSLPRPECRTELSQCLILAAGCGTRLRSVSSGLPKPLVPFRGKPILENVILDNPDALDTGMFLGSPVLFGRLESASTGRSPRVPSNQIRGA
jgi:hypothetical protein